MLKSLSPNSDSYKEALEMMKDDFERVASQIVKIEEKMKKETT
ncbi:MAG: hypothetical protein ACOYL6_08010 [Bacteriovoracaceae bacterium]